MHTSLLFQISPAPLLTAKSSSTQRSAALSSALEEPPTYLAATQTSPRQAHTLRLPQAILAVGFSEHEFGQLRRLLLEDMAAEMVQVSCRQQARHAASC